MRSCKNHVASWARGAVSKPQSQHRSCHFQVDLFTSLHRSSIKAPKVANSVLSSQLPLVDFLCSFTPVGIREARFTCLITPSLNHSQDPMFGVTTFTGLCICVFAWQHFTIPRITTSSHTSSRNTLSYRSTCLLRWLKNPVIPRRPNAEPPLAREKLPP